MTGPHRLFSIICKSDIPSKKDLLTSPTQQEQLCGAHWVFSSLEDGLTWSTNRLLIEKKSAGK